MNIKNIMFLTAIISCNISHVLQAYEESSKQMPEAQQILVNACKKRLEDLEKEEKDQYSHTTYCWYGAVAGAALIVLGSVAKDDKDGSFLKAGFATLITSGGIGAVSIFNENYKADLRRQERASLHDQLNRLPRNK